MQTTFLFVFCALLVVVAVVTNYILVRRQERREGQSPYWMPGQIDWDAIADEQLQYWLNRGNKIESIKRYRALTKAGLREAKDAIDYTLEHPDERSEKKKAPRLELDAPGIRDLLEEGRDDEAVEIYQKFAGVDEYTARDMVAKIKKEMQ